MSFAHFLTICFITVNTESSVYILGHFSDMLLENMFFPVRSWSFQLLHRALHTVEVFNLLIPISQRYIAFKHILSFPFYM